MKSIEDQLLLHEGLKLKPYHDTVGKLTIGVGRNLEDKGLTKDEALFLLRNDIAEVTVALGKYEWYIKLDPVRQKVLIDMAFNIGLAGLFRFKAMITALERSDYLAAAAEMVNSRWYAQTRIRAIRLVEMMRTGQDYEK